MNLLESHLYLRLSVKDRLQPANSHWIDGSLLGVDDSVSGEVERFEGEECVFCGNLEVENVRVSIAVPWYGIEACRLANTFVG